MPRASTIKTPKGTELPLVSIQGRPYLQVAHRLVWFREEHADWSIETEMIDRSEDSALFRAKIVDASLKVVATATKFENRQGFPDFIEKAETGAIGRALALCGYGTQFAPELDEGDRLADTPVEPARRSYPTEPKPRQPLPSKPISQPQKSMILGRCRDTGERVPENLDGMTSAEASREIERLLALPRKQPGEPKAAVTGDGEMPDDFLADAQDEVPVEDQD